jgi:uncharacterized protein YqhQ
VNSDSQSNYTSIGGQAVLEGVMMRSPKFVVVAVRKPDHSIVLKELHWVSLSQKFSFLKKPFFRGILTLFESLIYGYKTLQFSADQALEDDEKKQQKEPTNSLLKDASIYGSLLLSIVFGMGLFVVTPHLFTLLVGKLGLIEKGTQNASFHLVDGIFKLAIFVGYIFLISQMKEIRRVFQYHGAEHKSIYTFEKGKPLTVEEAAKNTTLHPRCGTSFLLFLVFLSIFIYTVVLPFIQPFLPNQSFIIHHASILLIKMALMLPIAGMSYELIRWTGSHMNNPVVNFFITPGLWLQNLTTKEPDNEQLEVALVSLKRVLWLERNPQDFRDSPMIIKNLNEIGSTSATLQEFIG